MYVRHAYASSVQLDKDFIWPWLRYRYHLDLQLKIWTFIVTDTGLAFFRDVELDWFRCFFGHSGEGLWFVGTDE